MLSDCPGCAQEQEKWRLLAGAERGTPERPQRDSCGLIQLVPASWNKEICPICTRETEWEARLTHLIDAPAQETCSGYVSQGVCCSLLVCFLQALGTDGGCRDPWGISNTKTETQPDSHNTWRRPETNQTTRGVGIQPSIYSHWKPGRCDPWHRYRPWAWVHGEIQAADGDSVCVGQSLAGAQSMNFSVYLAVTAPDGVGEV